MPTEGVKRKPMPRPKSTPCVRNRCQMRLAKLAQISEAVSMTTPASMVGLVPNSRVQMVAMGEHSSAQLMLREPTKA